ncbi:type II toxin-antitoxin system antitoxin SocA domain-containing protein [Nostoc sp.]|uniref:type II toxin-antitoxin system antitoxin SocA domain-containing protein n=1 Tax=Nostoc sp. TaxID=1180 RepID=UPI002FFB8A10
MNESHHGLDIQEIKAVSLLRDPGDEDLCEKEEEIIQQVYQAFGHLDPIEVAEWTHDLPEWKNPHGSAILILVEDILKNLGILTLLEK